MSRIFEVQADADVTLDGLTLTDGYYEGPGGAVVVYSDAPFSRATTTTARRSWSSRLRSRAALRDDDGGGIAAFADKYCSVEIRNSTISGNHADNDGGGIFFYGFDPVLRTERATREP